MMTVLREAGWPVYPVLFLGFISLALSIRFALTGLRELLPSIVGLAIATLAFGTFGTLVGLQHACEGLRDAPPDMKWLWLIGLKEALNCVDIALIFVILDALIAVRGGRKLIQRLDEAASRTHV